MSEQLGTERLATAKTRFAAWRWLSSTKDLQEQFYGYDFRAMARSPRAVCEYLAHMSFAAINEIVEAAYEFEWKHWTKDAPWYDRDLIVEELIDASMFIGNMAVALGVDDDEWARRYMAKQEVNRKRMLEKYSGRRPKP